MMRFHYAGKYVGPDQLPKREPMPAGAVAFREPDSAGMMGLIGNGLALVIFVVLYGLLVVRCGMGALNHEAFFFGALLTLATMVPHEFIHAICFRGDVYMYQALSKGLLFVVGPEDMTLGHFCFMSLLPATVLGVIPYLACMIAPSLTALGIFGAMALASAAGDFFNVFNAVTQMPRGALTFLSGFHSYWYLPESGKGPDA